MIALHFNLDVKVTFIAILLRNLECQILCQEMRSSFLEIYQVHLTKMQFPINNKETYFSNFSKTCQKRSPFLRPERQLQKGFELVSLPNAKHRRQQVRNVH